MFKIGSFEEELMHGMNHQLVAKEMDQVHGTENLSKAIDLLSKASELLEVSGMIAEAEEITSLLEKL